MYRYVYYSLDDSVDSAKMLANQARSWGTCVVMDDTIMTYLDQSFLWREIAIKLRATKMQEEGFTMTADSVEDVSWPMYELIGLFDSFNGTGVTALQKALPLFNRAMDLFKGQDWVASKQAFKVRG
jgi:hypothetical protein